MIEGRATEVCPWGHSVRELEHRGRGIDAGDLEAGALSFAHPDTAAASEIDESAFGNAGALKNLEQAGTRFGDELGESSMMNVGEVSLVITSLRHIVKGIKEHWA